MRTRLRHILRWIVNILFYLCMAGVAWVVCQVFLIASFKIPSGSMEPEVATGDHVLVLKPTIGARLFNLFAVARGEHPTVYRLPGIKEIKRNDVLVFNCPYPKDWNRVEMDILFYMIKRCVALPGDTLVIDKGFYQVKGIDMPLGNIASQQVVHKRKDHEFDENVFRSFPFDSIIHWNIKDFGPFYIPKEGTDIPMNRVNYVLYKKVIEWEQQSELIFTNDSTVLLDTKPITSYRFQKNYYFMAGDRVEDSQDSRYWGLLPEEYIVGKAWIVWKSSDPYTGTFRWNRFLKRIK